MTVTLTFDLEEFDFPLERGKQISLGEQMKVSTEGLMPLLALLERHKVPVTFYVTANYADHNREIIKNIAAAGHEIACHDYYHGMSSKSDPAGAKKLLEEIAGCEVVGYRSPRLGCTRPEELAKAGFRYNSSMNPTCIPGRYNNLAKPRSVFPEGGLLIYPVSVSYPLRVPLFWLSCHVMGTGLYKMLAKSAMKKDGHLNLYFHPWEFSPRLADKRFGIPFYITRCSGPKLLNKLDRLVAYFKAMNYEFRTTKAYLAEYE